MPQKQNIISELGADALLVPDQIGRSLVANDAVKYYFALLQTAKLNADHPRVPVPHLKAERPASRLGDAWLDDVLAGTRKVKDHAYAIPHVGEILSRTATGIDAMLACLPSSLRQPFLERVKQLPLPAPDDGAFAGQQIDAMTSGEREAGDADLNQYPSSPAQILPEPVRRPGRGMGSDGP